MPQGRARLVGAGHLIIITPLNRGLFGPADAIFVPLIITTERGIGGATALAQNVGLAERIDILEVEQFVATNVYEKSGFADSKRTGTISDLVERYNQIIDSCESDPSLRILVGS